MIDYAECKDTLKKILTDNGMNDETAEDMAGNLTGAVRCYIENGPSPEKKTGYNWEDPECDLIAAIRQIQDLLDEKL